jgi:hypothetical protein
MWRDKKSMAHLADTETYASPPAAPRARTCALGLIILVSFGAVALSIGLVVISVYQRANPSRAVEWRIYAYDRGALHAADSIRTSHPHLPSPCPRSDWPTAWDVRANLLADLNHDGAKECVLLVWRPWQDWPIMRWSESASPIAGNRDRNGDSSHIILIEPSTGRELWAGSALAVPIVMITVGDVDGDGAQELIALEGDYQTGRDGPARHLALWRWNGFGFTLEWRSPPDRLSALALSDLDRDGAAEILVR